MLIEKKIKVRNIKKVKKRQVHEWDDLNTWNSLLNMWIPGLFCRAPLWPKRIPAAWCRFRRKQTGILRRPMSYFRDVSQRRRWKHKYKMCMQIQNLVEQGPAEIRVTLG